MSSETTLAVCSAIFALVAGWFIYVGFAGGGPQIIQFTIGVGAAVVSATLAIGSAIVTAIRRAYERSE